LTSSDADPTATPPRLSDGQLGVIAVTLALRFPEWMQRRVEHIAYLDDVTVRERAGVMLRWPEPDFFPEGARPARGQMVYVPLDLLTKGPLIGLDGSRPDGSPFPILPFGRTAALAAAGITALVWDLSRQTRGIELKDDTVEIMQAVVASPAALARPLLRVFREPGSELGEVLGEHNELRGLLEELADSLLMLAPAVYEPGGEVVYRYTYCKPLPWERPRHNRFLALFGYADARGGYRNLALGRSASYHLEVEAPAEVRLTRARLYGVYDQPPGQAPITALIGEDGDSPVIDIHARRPTAEAFALADPMHPPSRPPLLALPAQDATPKAAVEAARRGAATAVSRSDRGYATLRFRPEPFGTFLATTVVSFLTALLLIAARTRLPELDGQISAALLLALPVLALGYLTRAGEHQFATRLLRGVRVAALAVGMCSLLVAGVLGGGFIHHPPAQPPDYLCSRLPAGRGAGSPGLTLRCVAQATPAGAASVPAGVEVVVDVATSLATLLALVLLVGWVSTYGRSSRRLPEPTATGSATTLTS
jgi:hypothetical protein